MKSEERHQLETNWLAIHVDHWIDAARPYSSTITGSIIAVVVLGLAWSYFTGASGSRQDEAWNAYNNVVSGSMDEQSVKDLGKSVAEYVDTNMAAWGNITEADGKVWLASRTLLQNRADANKNLDAAAITYRSILNSSRDEELVNRAHYGLARVFEMRNEPENAVKEYSQVNGTFKLLAERRVTELKDAKRLKTLDWLAKAEAPRITMPRSSPGQTQGLNVDDLKLPGVTGAPDPSKNKINIDELFKGMGDVGKEADKADRYIIGDPAKQTEGAKTDETKSDDKPATTEPAKEDSEKSK